jgi:hypothetical protein
MGRVICRALDDMACGRDWGCGPAPVETRGVHGGSCPLFSANTLRHFPSASFIGRRLSVLRTFRADGTRRPRRATSPPSRRRGAPLVRAPAILNTCRFSGTKRPEISLGGRVPEMNAATLTHELRRVKASASMFFTVFGTSPGTRLNHAPFARFRGFSRQFLATESPLAARALACVDRVPIFARRTTAAPSERVGVVRFRPQMLVIDQDQILPFDCVGRAGRSFVLQKVRTPRRGRCRPRSATSSSRHRGSSADALSSRDR